MAGGRPSVPRSEEELRAIYDQRYVDDYDAHAVRRIRRMLPFFELTGDDIAADFGCGNGVLLELISRRVRQYVGIDFSDAFVHAAERRRDDHGIQNGTFHCGDITTFCAQHANRFDVAFALDVSEHIYDDQFLRIGRAIHGALKPGGALYLHTPNAEYFMERLRASGILRRIEGHVAVRDAARNEALLTQCGFTNVRVRYLAHYLRAAAAFHGLGALPLIGRHFRARLFLSCRKGRRGSRH
jgi:2-polyprenyl-6-hydroxyphenyl methylase / 3-demethylubiquinone-9 3-methyltransferase